MAAVAASSAAASVRYAPEDPTLPKPWRGLVDSKTGYLYFWNPETNVTQYERPATPSNAGSVPSDELLDSCGQKSLGHHSEVDDEMRYNQGCNDSSAETASAFGASQVLQVVSNDSSAKIASAFGASQVPQVVSNDSSAEIASAFRASQSAESRQESQNDPSVTLNAGYGPNVSKGAETGLSGEKYCLHHEITVTGGNVPQPFTTFQATGFPSEILREMQQAGFSAPTPIQAQSWPIALQGRDIVAIARTGSGKTLGFLIPGFIHLKQRRNNPRLGPTILVLSPTRELATQIQDEAVKFSRTSRISCTCLYGGAPKGPQLKDLDRGVDVVVATPGRLNDILEMRRVSLHQVSYLVLDEADRMLDMGFEPQIRKIVKEVPPRRQTLMYTATWPKEVRKIAADLLENPVQVNIGNADELAANKSITQYIEVLSPMDKRRRLEQILRSQEPGSKIIIFCSTKKMCDQLAGNLIRQCGAAAIHGDKSQGERDQVLQQFRSGRSPVLVATDVAARGLDVKDIRVVINYDFPTGIEDYVHRIGRTGRAGATGEAYSFLCDKDAKHASELVKILEGANQNVPSELRDLASQGGGMGGGRRQWSSGPSERDGGFSGHYDSPYSGMDKGSAGGGMSSTPGRGFGGGHNEQQDRHGSESFGDDSKPAGGYKSFHESMMAAAKNGGRSRSRSPPRNSGWAANSSSAVVPTTKRSFHETMMEQARPTPSLNERATPNGNESNSSLKEEGAS